jgi:hypothetical protein
MTPSSFRVVTFWRVSLIKLRPAYIVSEELHIDHIPNIPTSKLTVLFRLPIWSDRRHPGATE